MVFIFAYGAIKFEDCYVQDYTIQSIEFKCIKYCTYHFVAGFAYEQCCAIFQVLVASIHLDECAHRVKPNLDV